MAYFYTKRAQFLIAIFLSLLLCVPVFAQMSHTQHAPKTELGISIAVDSDGLWWNVHKENNPDKTSNANDAFLVIQTSKDAGQTWSDSIRILQNPEPISADGENRPKIAFGNQHQIYISYTKPLAKPYTGEIRFVHSADGGKTFSTPITVHHNQDLITHRFESMVIDKLGRIFIAWIDKRDAEAAKQAQQKYSGAAIYYAVSNDSGKTFSADYKLADHSCECCRIALSLNNQGNPIALWRHVFDVNSRDHAFAQLSSTGLANVIERATFDNWHIDACPHQGPAMAMGKDDIRYQTWFNVRGEEGGLFYAAINPNGKIIQTFTLGSAQAAHADVAVVDNNIGIVWKDFDGVKTQLRGKFSSDMGAHWQELLLFETMGNSDHPHLLVDKNKIYWIWHTQQQGLKISLFDNK